MELRGCARKQDNELPVETQPLWQLFEETTEFLTDHCDNNNYSSTIWQSKVDLTIKTATNTRARRSQLAENQLSAGCLL